MGEQRDGECRNHQNSKPLVEGALLTAIAVFLGLFTVYFPPLQIVVRFLYPLPIIILSIRHGMRWAVIGTAAAGILTAVISGFISGLMLTFGFGVAGLALGYGFKHNYSPLVVVLLGILGFLISQGIMLLITFAALGVNPLQISFEAIQSSMDNVLGLYSEWELLEPEEIIRLEETLETSIQALLILLPALFIVSTGFTAVLNYIVGVRVLSRLNYRVKFLPPFKKWRFSPVLVGTLTATASAVTLGSHFDLGTIKYAGYNFIFIAAVLLIVQGLSLLFHYAEHYSVPRWLKVILIILIVINAYFFLVLLLIGVLDTILNYRDLKDAGESYPVFSHWFFPHYTSWFFLAGLLIYIGSLSADYRFLTAFSLFILFFSGMAVLLQGMAVGAYYLERYLNHMFLKMILCVIIIINPLFLQAALMLGILDHWFDYRGLKKVA